jgi:hypothetical protein
MISGAETEVLQDAVDRNPLPSVHRQWHGRKYRRGTAEYECSYSARRNTKQSMAVWMRAKAATLRKGKNGSARLWIWE